MLQKGKFFQELADKATYVFEKVITPIYQGFLKNSAAIVAATEKLLGSVSKFLDPKLLDGDSWEAFGEFMAELVAAFLLMSATLVNDLTPALQRLVIVLTSLLDML